MSRLQQQVEEFHSEFGIKIHKRPYIGDHSTRLLRIKLIEEEFQEFVEACGFEFKHGKYLKVFQPSIVKIADALGDLLYVVYGSAVSFGIEMDEITDEIHRSNMTKVGGYKNDDGKWIKPDSYEPAKLVQILAKQSRK